MYIIDMVDVRKKLDDEKGFVKFLFEAKFKYYEPKFKDFENFSIFMAVLINLIMIFSIYYRQDKNGEYVMVFPYQLLVFILSLIHLVVVFAGLFGYFYKENFKRKKFDEIYKERLNENKNLAEVPVNKRHEVTIFSDAVIILNWNFFIGLIAILDYNLNFLYSLQLFSLISLFPTMRAVISAVRFKYKQFLAAGFIILIFIMFFASIGIIFFQNEFFNSDLQV